MTKKIVFIHGAFMTPLCWDKFIGFFEGKGYTCIAPPWPYKDRPIAEQRQNPDPGLMALGVAEIVQHYADIIRAHDEPPILIGHSFGGLFVQMLLDRGLGAAGVAINSAPPKGVWPFYPAPLRSLFSVLSVPFGWRKIVRMSYPNFQYAFVNSLPEPVQRAAYDQYAVPEAGRIFFQGATAMFHNVTRVNFQNSGRAPLLLIAGTDDHLCPEAQIHNNYRKYQHAQAVTEFKSFRQRTHWMIGQDGWQEVADFAASWLARLKLE